MAAPARSTPRDAQVMAAILKDMGVLEYEPRLINTMLEFVYRYVTDILDDAKVYSSYAGKKNIDLEDTKMAIQCRMDHSFTSPPPRDLLMEIAKHKNSQVLPLIKPYTGLRLPPDRYCLSAPNYKMAGHRVSKKHQSRIQIGMNQIPGGSLSHQRINITPHGKIGGSGLTVVTKNVSIPTVTIVTKPSSQPTVLTKPAIRIAGGGSLASYAPKMKVTSLPQTSPSISMLPSSQQATASIPGSQPSIRIQPISTTTSSLISNPLKRKHEDDDYDT
ncbi:transcription initiation factor TFIID subunit 9B-like isoform X1 [Argopecten irradians]|uniref:transcription initiation factor TFIID subunit 9B-like isoform X1 n=1 Tax=Argopecten irradians TaxID=31199 RepID=UPI00371AB940